MSELQNLIDTIDKDRRLGAEVLRKLPDFVSSENDVTFDLDEPVTVPSIVKMQTELTQGGLSGLSERISSQEDLSRGLIQEVGRLANEAGLSRDTPYWSPLDLSIENSDAEKNNPLYRSQVEDGVRFPYDGYLVNNADRRFESEGQKIGSYLMPQYTEETDHRHNLPQSAQSSSGYDYFNAKAYPVFNRTVIYRRIRYYLYYYGYYYRWRAYRYGYYNNASLLSAEVQKQFSTAMTAQTFQVSDSRVLTGIDVVCYRPRNYQSANPKLLLVESVNGSPNLDNVLAEGIFRQDSSYTSSQFTVPVRADLDKPIILEAKKSYAFVLLLENNYQVHYTTNKDATGGLFHTQDGHYWSSDMAKDLAYNLVYADFGSAAEHVIELESLSLSGGISSIKTQLAVNTTGSAELELQISINDQWRPIGIVEDLQSLPPFTPVRAIFKGSQYSMPLLDTEKSEITAFRPATNVYYISTDRVATATQRLRVVYEMTGFDDDYHTFSPALIGGNGTIVPTVVESKTSSDGFVKTLTATYELPDDVESFQHVITADTQTALRLFDISSVIELSN